MSDTELACDASPWGVAGFVNALSDIRRAGFTGVEAGVDLVPHFEDRVHILQEMLEAEGLSLVTIHTPLRHLSAGSAEEESERCLNVARFLGAMECEMLIVGAPPHDPGAYEEEWLLFTNLLAEVGKRAAEFGVRLMVNPEPGTICGTRSELEKLLKMFPVKALPLATDAAFLALSGIAPATYFKKYKNRLGHIYLSDVRKPRSRPAPKKKKATTQKKRKPKAVARPAPHRTMLGKGIVPLGRFLDAATAAKYSGWVTVRLPGAEVIKSPAACTAAGFRIAGEALDIV